MSQQNELRIGVPIMRLGVGVNTKQYMATHENIQAILHNNTIYQNNWLRGLIDCINHVKNRIVVRNVIEVGSFQGESTSLFALYFNPEVLYAVDPHSNGYDDKDSLSYCNFDDVIHNFKVRTAQYPCVKYIQKTSADAANQFADNSFDFVYIDGDHTFDGVMRDIKAYFPKLREGGFFGGHDLGRKEVTDAVVECFGDADILFDDSSWLVCATPEHRRAFAQNDLPGDRKRKSVFVPVTEKDFEIDFLQKHGRAGQVDAMFDFFKYLQDSKIETVVEVDSFDGQTTAILAKHLKPKILYAIDKLDHHPNSVNSKIDPLETETLFQKHTQQFECVKFLKYRPDVVLSDLFESQTIDLLYIRGSHSKEYIKDVIKQALPKMAANGFITGEGWGGGYTVNACLETIGEPDIYFKNSLWIKRIKKTQVKQQ